MGFSGQGAGSSFGPSFIVAVVVRVFVGELVKGLSGQGVLSGKTLLAGGIGDF